MQQMVFLIIKAECSNKIDCERTCEVDNNSVSVKTVIFGRLLSSFGRWYFLPSNLIRENVVVNSSKMEKNCV